MIEVMEEKNSYLSDFQAFETRLGHGEPHWIRSLRKAAIVRFAELGFPTTRHEDWKYTSVAPITRTAFKPAGYELNGLGARKLHDISPLGTQVNQLVFVNGHFSPELSSLDRLPGNLKAGSLAAALDSDPGSLEPYLGRYASFEQNAFTALNTAFMRDGAFLLLPEGSVIPEPIHLLFVSTARRQATVIYPRNLIVAGAGCRLTVVESYIGVYNDVYFTNAVTEVVADDESVVEHYKVQQESEKAFHVGCLQAHPGRSSNFSSCFVSLGGSLVRNDVNAVLDREGIECTLNGLYLTRGKQHVDNQTSIDHAQPHCSSRELYKGILDGKSSGVFNGKIVVRKDAQKTNARQTNKNLLLSDHALVNTKPQLQISADDVKCTHGATIGQLDDEALFYMRTRGMGEETARSLLTYAFASEVVAGIKVEALRSHVDGVLLRQVPRSKEGL
jgi:Fe-S cluster assembly protein SufD